ncbi:MAG: hypothetical protein Kow00105_16180 [Phycisphaeraceae bacterium]
MKPAELITPPSEQASVAVAEQAVNAPEASAPAKPRPKLPAPPKVGWFKRKLHRLEARISRLSTRNNFWHRVCSWVFLPLAYRSGIKFKHVAKDSFSVILPFRRFNKNWYSAMAGASLLANSEVAGGMFVFGKCGGDYTVVCKHLDYKFLRPCYGPAIYNIHPREDIEELVKKGGEFNITLDMTVVQAVHKKDKPEPRVGKAVITFHVTPKAQVRARRYRRLKRLTRNPV